MRKTATIVGLALIGAFGGMQGGMGHVSAQAASPPSTGDAIVQTALSLVGTHYVGTSSGRSPQTGFSDVGFVAYVYNQNGIKLHINWNANNGYVRLPKDGPAVQQSRLQPGDLVYFKNTIFAGLSHVGIYVGDGKFIHAEWYGYGVTVTSLSADPRDGSYWSTHYLSANRPWTG